jgi:hypothetical protein
MHKFVRLSRVVHDYSWSGEVEENSPHTIEILQANLRPTTIDIDSARTH